MRSLRACSFDLTPSDVDVWQVADRASETVLARLKALLSPEERERARQFVVEQTRHTFVTARGTLRYLLSRYLDVDPATLRFRYGPHGKPAIEGGEIGFNMSHSGGLIAGAFARGCDVGIDIERIRPDARNADIVSRFFSQEEAAKINALPPRERQPAFFHFWTRKEAYIKATGEGLPGIKKASGEAWTVHDLNVPPGYAGALAYSGKPRRVTLQDHELELT